MKFTNISPAGVYLQCCHREVDPGDSFSVPWGEFHDNRALREAMRAGVLAWESEKDEPHVPGSVKLPSDAERSAERDRKAKAKAADDKRKQEELAARKARDDEAVKRNMARMGKFNVPQVTPFKRVSEAVSKEAPITKADVIADDKPTSLASIRRHNKAVKGTR